jgi:hypothetical protein
VHRGDTVLDQEKALLAYLAIRPTKNDDGYIGGVLVVDETGVPQEFRCTRPVKPTKVQQALYGDVLVAHISNGLVGIPLLNALVTNPVCCIVENSTLLEIANDVNLPVVHMERLGDLLSVDSSQSEKSKKPQKPERIDSERGGFSPISANFLHGHQSDWETIGDSLKKVFNQVDLLEPFERITTAINILMERDEHFS